MKAVLHAVLLAVLHAVLQTVPHTALHIVLRTAISLLCELPRNVRRTLRAACAATRNNNNLA
eukprot:6198625-Pleurochrysis_carterae.AAC.4